MDKVFDVDKVIKQEDELKCTKSEEEQILDEYRSLKKINED